VVITRKGGTADYFQDLAEYVAPQSIGEIRAATMRAWERPASSALRDHVLQHLTWEQSAKQLTEAYRRHA
jgi:hypothetical protein